MTDQHGQVGQEDFFLDAETIALIKAGQDMKDVAAAWLRSFALHTDGMRQGLVVMAGVGKNKFEPSAMWPEGASPAPEVMRAVNGVVKTRQMIVETGSDETAAIALPIMLNGQLRGAVSVLVDAEADGGLRQVIDKLHMSTGWIEAALRRQRVSSSDNLVTVIELLATSLHHARFSEAATAVATELSGALGCELGAIGLIRRRHARVRALSNSATFGKRSNLVRAIEEAMDEAIDQQSVIVYPPPEDAPDRVLRAHKALSDMTGGTSLCTIPLTEQGKITGALLLERSETEIFDESAVKTAEYAAILVGPILDVKRREDRWLPAKTWDATANLFKAIFGPRHAALKLSIIVLALFGAFCWFATGPYRVTAESVVEGRIQRVATAPLAGFLIEANVRAGDIVSSQQVMARLDDRDIRLERLKWTGERTKQEQEYSAALAQRDRTKARILASQIEQADAQIALLDQQLARMTIVAPFDGIVVSGDLTQALGAPLERGDVLFEIAPLDEYRVILRVDERDIKDIQVGQTGPLVLSALPDTPFEIGVERITPISSVENGSNFFIVEASVRDGPNAALRPGMEGVAKVEVDERRLVTIWSRKVVLWARMTLWSWWP